jgi:hypothetical protein
LIHPSEGAAASSAAADAPVSNSVTAARRFEVSLANLSRSGALSGIALARPEGIATGWQIALARSRNTAGGWS